MLSPFCFLFILRKLRYNRDDAAMLMNLCLALLVSVILFAVGIYHVNNTLMCRAVGVLLHYFVLCSLLWVGCGALCLCRMLRTAVTPEEFNPVLRYYMTSWGEFFRCCLFLTKHCRCSASSQSSAISNYLITSVLSLHRYSPYNLWNYCCWKS